MFVSRALLAIGIYSWCEPLELIGRWQKSAFLFTAFSLSIMRDYSFMGNGGLMIDTFTHSELGNGLALLAVSAGARQRYIASFALAGLVGFVNLFMGVWLAPLIMALVFRQLRLGRVRWDTLAQRTWPGIVFGLAFLVPVLVNLSHNPDLGTSPAFDFRVFLSQFWPLHFFVQNQPRHEVVGILIVFATWVGFTILLPSEPRKVMFLLGTVVVLVWICGAILPLVTASSLLLNLHVLRISTYFHLFAGLSAAAVLARWLTGREPADRLFWGPALLAASSISIATAVLVAPLLVLRLLWSGPTGAFRIALRIALLGLTTARLALVSQENIHNDVQFSIKGAAWQDVARWANAHTSKNAIFLLPVETLYYMPMDNIGARYTGDLTSGNEIFEAISHRRRWVSSKGGAAVMWTPSYYQEWRTRIRSVLTARTPGERLDYARRNGISFVVDNCVTIGNLRPVFRSGELCVFPAAPPKPLIDDPSTPSRR